MRALRLILALVVGTPSAYAATTGFTRPAVVLECPTDLDARSVTRDWRAESIFKGIYQMEDFTPGVSPHLNYDSSSIGNNYNANDAASWTTRRTLVAEGCRAFQIVSTFQGASCDSPNCNDADFCPTGDFTVGYWTAPADFVATLRSWTTFGVFSAVGWGLGWAEPGTGAGNFFFDIKRTAVASNVRLTTIAAYTPEQYHHVVGRYHLGTMNIVVDGITDSNTASSAAITEDCDGAFFGFGSFGSSSPGFYDEAFYVEGALDNATICRIAVCGISGNGCSCDDVNLDDYDYAPKHTSFGGPLTCTLPACDANPQLLTTTTTSTSTSTSSTSSSTSTSTSSTTSTTL